MIWLIDYNRYRSMTNKSNSRRESTNRVHAVICRQIDCASIRLVGTNAKVKSIFDLAKCYNPVSIFSIAAFSTAIPAATILSWISWSWTQYGSFHRTWALTGLIFMLISAQEFGVGIIAKMMKRSEIRVERLLRENEEVLQDRLHHEKGLVRRDNAYDFRSFVG